MIPPGSSADERLLDTGSDDPAQTQQAAGGAPSMERRPRMDAQRLLGRYAVVLVLLAMLVVFSILRPDSFFTAANFRSLATTQAVLVVVSLGLTIALATGEFDLSIAAVLGFSASLVAYLTGTEQWAAVPAVLVSLAAALTIGALNALFVVGFGVNSFITTLGMGTFVGGIAVAIVGPTTTGGIPSVITDPARATLFTVGLPFWFALVLVVALWFFLEHTPAGRYVFFTGEGREAARLAGIAVSRIRCWGLITSALGAWLAGMILLGQTGAANPTFGDAFMLPAFAAAFLGATTIRAGRYNAWGTLVAVYLLAVGTTGLQLLGAADWVSDVFNGAVLVLAVTFAGLVSRQRTRRLARSRVRASR
jgi:ribose transport system permease protein